MIDRHHKKTLSGPPGLKYNFQNALQFLYRLIIINPQPSHFLIVNLANYNVRPGSSTSALAHAAIANWPVMAGARPRLYPDAEIYALAADTRVLCLCYFGRYKGYLIGK
ncbi:hypothetical protein GWI33_000186 [Rhynchophorus ferrugineus]|uniref:Uncharacterized protein n=1 Tax=Rhynchophorus ferrugineus TaxID=354439 RepID=A0A834ML46_RHYFE|nr:hypothetical protein GWI33_000186 [Rhynchophorus ferrugineus]